ncbi:MAG: threonine-phosphate decarboxylase CobD [Halopseudomonas sp.]|uniref:threonine-phosphate decarboxylase CobD n=1 Tax=Halopseudomonas sp. TaxID=2901191 RepID=UPI003001A206
MLEHGGRLQRAARDFGIPLAQWLDISTGLAPYHWPLPPLPAGIWSRLPEPEDGLCDMAAAHYNAPSALPVAGSQAAIQALPLLRSRCRVGILEPTYAEHRRAWQRAGHEVVSVRVSELEQQLEQLDVLVVVNPNNPTGAVVAPPLLLDWHQRLTSRGGWLVVDEAFADATPDISLSSFSHLPGLIILRSFGKFFGLAGVRLGFVLAEEALLGRLEQQLGPWAVSGPARAVGMAVLADQGTQQLWRSRLQMDSRRLQALLERSGLPGDGSCLFQWRALAADQARRLYLSLAMRGVLIRLFPDIAGVRFGLPGSDAQWKRLESALSESSEEWV